jgi:PadR family transcriptional regulator, regulatory protein PadR
MMMGRINLTYPVALVLAALAAGHRYGFDIMEVTGLPSGTVYPLLRRLESGAYVVAQWEGEEPAQREGRPQRRYYSITDAGRELLARARSRFATVDAGLRAAVFGRPGERPA